MNRVHMATAGVIASIANGERRWIEVDTVGDYTITDGKTFLVAHVTHVTSLGGHYIGSLDPFVIRAGQAARGLVPVKSAAEIRAEEDALEAAVAARWTDPDDDRSPA